jgi:hypothetical protein
MTTTQALITLSTLLGGLGLCLTFKYSATVSQFSPYWNAELIAKVKDENAKRLKIQWFGFGLLIVSSLFACASAFTSPDRASAIVSSSASASRPTSPVAYP